MGRLTRWRTRRVADPDDAGFRRRLVPAVVITTGLLLVQVWLNLQVLELGYRVDATRKLIEKLELEQAELKADVSHATAPDHLRRLAGARLGLRVPTAGQVVTVDAEP